MPPTPTKIILRPDAIGFYNLGSRVPWTTNTGVPIWSAIDEANSDGDTTYVYSSEPGPFTVNFDDCFTRAYVRPVRVGSATLVATCRLDGAIPTRFKFRLRHLGVDYDSDEYEITSNTYIEIAHVYHQIPNGQGWTAVGLNGLEAGIVYVSGGSELRCTKLELQVHVEPYTHQTLAPVADSAAPNHQQWDNFPGTTVPATSVGRFDGDQSYIHSSTLWDSKDTPVDGILYSVYGFAQNDVYAVGGIGSIVHWDGSDWSTISTGIGSLSDYNLYGVWGDSPTSVFVVGEMGTVLYWDGLYWTQMLSGVAADLFGVWGSSATDVYAVGVNGTIIHWNGAVWSTMASGVLNNLNDVWVAGVNQVYACGANGVIVYYDGIVWATQPSGVIWELHSLWGSAVNNVYAVGQTGTILNYDGFNWNPQVSGTLLELRGVCGDASTTDRVAVGDDGIALRWTGTAWVEQPTHQTNDLFDVWGTLSTNIFAVGDIGTSLVYEEAEWEPIYVFTLSNVVTPLKPPIVDNVQVSCIVKNTADTPAHAGVVIRSAGTDYYGAHGTAGWIIPPDGVWHIIEEELLNDPSTGWPSGAPGSTGWTSAEADLLEAGIINFGGSLRCTSIGVETFQKNTPITTHDMFPTADGYHQQLPALVPGAGESPWQDIDEDPPDYAASYIGADADAAESLLYGSFVVGPSIGALPAGEQVYALEARLTMRLGPSTTSTLVAPILRYNNETYIGRTFPVNNTAGSWFDIKEDFYTSPFTGNPWTVADIDATEYGMVILEGEAYLTRLRVQIQTAPEFITAAPGATDLQLTDLAATPITGYIDRSTVDGTMYAVRDFAIGTGGFNPAAPATVVPVNTADVALVNELYRGRIERITYDTTNYPVNPQEVTYWCRVPKDVAIDTIGEIGLFAQIIWSPIPAEIGSWFMFALAHIPCQCRHPKTVHLHRLKIEYP